MIHSYASMIDARIGAIACGHEDCDDLDVLRHDPALKMFCEKSPEADVGLASQPTLSRLENAVGWRVLARMGLRMIDTFCDSFARPPRQIVLDIYDTTDLVHGGQQLSLFNTPGGGYCFQPILIFEAATGKPVAAILRAGKRSSGEEAARVLCHAVRRMRSNWPRIAITVRGDAHYGTPEVMDVLEDMDCLYIFGLSGNKGLADISAPWLDDVATRRALGGKEKVRRFSRRIMRPEAGGATGASLPVLRQRRWVRTPASSAPTSQAAGQNTSMRRSTAPGAAWKKCSKSTSSI